MLKFGPIRLTVIGISVLLVVSCGLCQTTAPSPEKTITVTMEDCNASRPASLANVSVWSLLLGATPKEELVKRGTVELDGHQYTLFLPKAKTYSTINTKSSDDEFENTSTLISVEQIGEGQKKFMDGWFANLHIRLGDKMYDVTEIAADGSRIVLRPSKGPLHGVIVGRACPTFSFKTPEGKEYTRESLNGKAYLLDIWSTT